MGLPVIAASLLGGLGAGASLFPGLMGGEQNASANLPIDPQVQDSVIDDEIISQTEKNRTLRRMQNQKSKSFTSLQNNPIQEDSLLRILAGGQ